LYFIGVLGAPKHHLFRKYRDHTLDHPTSGKCRGRLYQFYSTWVLGVGPPSRDKDGSTVPALSSVSRFHGKWKTENEVWPWSSRFACLGFLFRYFQVYMRKKSGSLVHHFRPKDTLTAPTPLVNGTQGPPESESMKRTHLGNVRLVAFFLP
jgi:hypothetical protein